MGFAVQDDANSPRFSRSIADAGEALRTPRWLWPAILLLAALLAAQILIGGRNVLGANPAMRPLVDAVCGALRCTVAPLSQPAQLRMLDHAIHAHPTRAGVLVVNASFRNDAEFAQAWPVLQLTLSDINGQLVSRGRFTPAQYLPAGVGPAATIGAGQTAAIELNVRDPAQKAVSFDFELLPATGGVASSADTR